MTRKAGALILAGGLLSACASVDFANAPEAVLTNSSDKTRTEITQAISKALNGKTVTIAPDSLTVNSRLIIEQQEFMGPDGLPIMGRRYDRPDHFTLKISGSSCALLHEQTGEFYPLQQARCQALP